MRRGDAAARGADAVRFPRPDTIRLFRLFRPPDRPRAPRPARLGRVAPAAAAGRPGERASRQASHRSDPLATAFPYPALSPPAWRGVRPVLALTLAGCDYSAAPPPLTGVPPGASPAPTVGRDAGPAGPSSPPTGPGRRPPRSTTAQTVEKAAILDNVIKLIQAAAVKPRGEPFRQRHQEPEPVLRRDDPGPSTRSTPRPASTCSRPCRPTPPPTPRSKAALGAHRPGRCPTPGTSKTACSTRGSPAGSPAWATT